MCLECHLGWEGPKKKHLGVLPLHNTKDGMGDRSEFVELCSKAGRQACEQGQYREAIRLLHLGPLGPARTGCDVLDVGGLEHGLGTTRRKIRFKEIVDFWRISPCLPLRFWRHRHQGGATARCCRSCVVVFVCPSGVRDTTTTRRWVWLKTSSASSTSMSETWIVTCPGNCWVVVCPIPWGRAN